MPKISTMLLFSTKSIFAFSFSENVFQFLPEFRNFLENFYQRWELNGAFSFVR